VRLQGAEKARVEQDQLLDERCAVQELWEAVLGDSPPTATPN
jgi:glutamate-ammonia-ligase adenylyltransferase